MSDRDIAEPIKFLKFAELVGTIAKRSKPRTNEQRKADRKKECTWSPAYEVFYNFSRYIQAKPLRASTTSIVFRFLFPEEDHKRKFGLRADGLISEIGDVLRISKSRVDALENDIPGKQVQTLLDATWSGTDEYAGNLSLFEVDELLNQLASTSPWSHSSFSKKKSLTGHDKPTRKNILRSLYRQMSPFEAAVLSQIILKDLRGLLYPQLELDPTAALRDYNTKAIQVLTKESAMRAWDPSNRMNRGYRARWDVDDAAHAFESGQEVRPEIGFQIAVPKSQKGRSAKHALSFFSNASQVWAETKYDGERAQIHVQVGSGGRPQIKIFSKSKRDSTQDRKAIHPIILECLGFGRPGKKPRIGKSVILDAEMVACEGTKILEFWRIRKLIRDTAAGIRRRGSKKDDEEYLLEDSASESSLVSNSEGQHLGLVFFDCMYLEDESLVQQPYCRRREILEQLIIPESGRAMLADRWLIDLQSHSQACDLSSDEGDEAEDDDDSDATPARRALHKILARRLAAGEEGLVLKAADSEYNEPSRPWVKLKKDYIEGLGDTVDLVLLAAACVPDRALELRVPLTTMTTFYIGAQTNKQDTDNDPTAKPHFYIYFTAAYGLSRAELETLNFFMKTNSIACAKTQSLPRDELEYTYQMYDKLARPELMLRAPIAVELFGDRFTVAEGSKQYELRWPRITKFFRDRERSWRDCISLQALHTRAREAMGRVPLEEEARKDVEILFNRRGSLTKDSADRTMSSGVHARVEMWRARVAEADKPKKARRKGKEGKGSSGQAVLTSPRKRKVAEVGGPVKRQKICNADGDGIPRNLSEWSISHLSFPVAASRSSRDQRPSQHPGKRSRVDIPLSHSVFSERVSATNPTINYSSRSIALEGKRSDITPSKEPLFKDGTIPLQTTANSNMIHPVFHGDFRPASQSAHDENTQPTAEPVTAPSSGSHSPLELSLAERVHYPSPPTSPLKPKETSGTEHTKSSSVRLDASRAEVPVDEFFKDAVLWVPPSKARFRSSGLPSIVKSATLLNGLEAFFNACRWNPKNNHLITAAPPTRGIVLLDLHDEYGPQWMRNVLDGIRARMTIWKPTDEPRKMIWIFDRRTEFKKGMDRRSQALYVFE